MRSSAPIIAIASHRGGSWKSSLAAGLALQLARSGVSVALVDPARAGGLAAADSDSLVATTLASLKLRTHTEIPLRLLHRPELLRAERPGQQLAEIGDQLAADVVLVDLPTASREEMASLLRDVRLVIITVPVDVVSFRSLPPFLEQLKEQRAMPGRSFDVRAVLTGTSQDNPRLREIGERIADHLQPILLPGSLPLDDSYGARISSGSFPDESSISPALRTQFLALSEATERLISLRSVLQ
jgi:cellulose biosynthesis protein BcsQ